MSLPQWVKYTSGTEMCSCHEITFKLYYFCLKKFLETASSQGVHNGKKEISKEVESEDRKSE